MACFTPRWCEFLESNSQNNHCCCNCYRNAHEFCVPYSHPEKSWKPENCVPSGSIPQSTRTCLKENRRKQSVDPDPLSYVPFWIILQKAPLERGFTCYASWELTIIATSCFQPSTRPNVHNAFLMMIFLHKSFCNFMLSTLSKQSNHASNMFFYRLLHRVSTGCMPPSPWY